MLQELAKRLGIPEEYLLTYFTPEELSSMSVLEIRQEYYRRFTEAMKRNSLKKRIALSLHDCGLLSAYKKTPAVDLPEDLENLYKDFLSSDKAFLIIHGPVGTYKTRMMLRFTQRSFYEYIKKGVYPSFEEMFYVSWTSLLALYHTQEAQAKEAYAKAIATNLLFLDDFLAGFDSEFFVSLGFLLVSERYTPSKKTVITTNSDLKALRMSAEGDLLRLTDRLLDKDLSLFYKTQGKSLRTANLTLAQSLKQDVGLR